MLGLIVWSGHGYLVAVVTFGCLLASEFITERIMNDDRYYQSHGWPKLAGFSAAAILVSLVARWLDGRGVRRLVDPETGEEFELGGGDSFFFIPVRFWGAILVAAGFAFLFVRE